jgi:hypothetical protein
MDMRPILLGLLLLLRVFLDPPYKLLSRSREGNVLDSNIDTLLDVSVADLLVDDDSNGGFRDVVNDAGFAMVDFVWHAGRRLESTSKDSREISYPFWTAPFALISTMSPTLESLSVRSLSSVVRTYLYWRR